MINMNTIIRYITFLVGITYLVSCKGSYSLPNEQAQAQLQTDCAPIISWIEYRYKVDGHYPDALSPDIDAKLKQIDPYSSYAISPNRDHCEVCIGNYSKYEWVYCWWSKDKKWKFDG